MQRVPHKPCLIRGGNLYKIDLKKKERKHAFEQEKSKIQMKKKENAQSTRKKVRFKNKERN